MKHKLIYFLLVILCSCGKDGIDGNIYLAITPGGNCIDSYTDNNYSIPYGFIYGYSYGPCDDGTYSYTYYFCGGGGWQGTYSIHRNPGTEGGFLHSGDDGADRYFTFTLGAGGGYISGKANNDLPQPSESDTSATEFVRQYEVSDYIIQVEGHRIAKDCTGEKQNTQTSFKK